MQSGLSQPLLPEIRQENASSRAWQGARPLQLAISVAVGVVLRFAVPKPSGISAQAWQLLCIFLSAVIGLVLNPMPIGAWAFVCLTATVLTGTLSFSSAFRGFTNEAIWFIVVSFFFARGFVKAGLGDRVAAWFIRWFGKTTLGLSYGLVLSEAVIVPAIPSTTARSGGVFLPIIVSLSLSAGSRPRDETSNKIGAYLIQSQLQHHACNVYLQLLFWRSYWQASGNSSGLFLTAAAQNLLCLKLAEDLGIKIESPWVVWLKAASIPATVALLANPYFLYKLFPPEIKNTPDAPAMAARKLEDMGPMTRDEWVMFGTMLLAILLWVFGEKIGIASAVTAMIGLSILLLCGVLNWEDCLNEKPAWDTLAWFAVLIGMADELVTLGIVQWLSDCVAAFLESLYLSWYAAFGILHATYFLIHYLFASQTGHVAALFSAFLAMNMAAGVPGLLAALTLAYNTNLFGALTHYSSGQAAVYYGAGYVKLPVFFKLGFITGIFNLVIWSVVGLVWWKVIGLY